MRMAQGFGYCFVFILVRKRERERVDMPFRQKKRGLANRIRALMIEIEKSRNKMKRSNQSIKRD